MNFSVMVIGLAVGTLIGMTGVGGASVMTPLLMIMHVPPLAAVGTDLLYNLPTKFFGAFLHNRRQAVNWELVKTLCIAGLPAAAIGAFLLAWLRTFVEIETLHQFTRQAVGAAVLIAAVVIILTPLVTRGREKHSKPIEWNASLRLKVAAIGAIVGIIVTITSVGCGAVTLPLLALALPFVGLRDLVGTDIAFAALLIPTALVGRASLEEVDFFLAANLLVGSFPGVFLGSKLCAIIPQNALRPVVAITLLLVGCQMLWR